ncbi:MAG: serine/threonine-protein kinase [Gemmatimonadota bacterium]
MTASPMQADPFEQLLREALAPTYLLVRKLGAGGMGSVYLARDPTLKRNVAVKVLAPELADDPGPRARFQREAEAVASLSHPNVVSVYSVGKLANGVPYFVMQFVNGRSSADRIETDGPFDLDSAKRCLGDVASALAAAHRQGIIHRDIKPANILHDDESNRALVTDFGIASVIAAGADEPPISPTREDIATAVTTRLTQTGAMVGTPAYMSPEQLLAEPVTEKTDIYSLGLLGYELLTGQGPYAISSPGDVIAAHIRDAPKLLSSVRQDVDPELESLLQACLAKEAARRPSADEVATRLARGADVLLEWPPPALEPLHGRLRAALVPLGVGALLFFVPLGLALGLKPDSVWRKVLPSTSLLTAIATVGGGLGLLGVARLWRLSRAAVAAVGAGHGWLTAVEAMSDHRRDGGALIVGGREYATLNAAQRDSLRRQRLLSIALVSLAAVAPMLGFAAAVLIGRFSGLGPQAMLWSVTALPTVIWVGVGLIDAREALSMRSARERLRRLAPHDAASSLTGMWREAFEEARRGQSLGTGLLGRQRLLGAVGLAAAAVVLVLTVLSFAIGSAAAASTSKYSAFLVDERAADASFWYRRNEQLRAYGVAVDSTISPRRAGEALHAVLHYWRREDDASQSSLLRTPVRSIAGGRAGRRPPRSQDAPVNKVFGGTSGGNWVFAALRKAPRGFDARQRAILVEAATNAAAGEFAILSRAPRTDFWAAALVVPLPGGADLLETNWAMMDRFQAAASASLAGAAIELSEGRPAAAELIARSVIGAGFAMMEDRSGVAFGHGPFLVSYGAQGLRELYAATGRTDELVALIEADRYGGNGAIQTFDIQELSDQVRARILSAEVAPYVRWSAALFIKPYLPCLDLRRLVFSPSASDGVSWAEARASLVRDSLDAILIRFAEKSLEHPTPLRYGASLSERIERQGYRVLDRLVGGHRFEACFAHRAARRAFWAP